MRVNGFKVNADDPAGQALKFMQHLFRRRVRRHTHNTRIFAVEHVDQNNVRTLRGCQFCVGDTVK
ncbi:hypothetical protein D3C75_703100 [compost metagenome]